MGGDRESGRHSRTWFSVAIVGVDIRSVAPPPPRPRSQGFGHPLPAVEVGQRLRAGRSDLAVGSSSFPPCLFTCGEMSSETWASGCILSKSKRPSQGPHLVLRCQSSDSHLVCLSAPSRRLIWLTFTKCFALAQLGSLPPLLRTGVCVLLPAALPYAQV